MTRVRTITVCIPTYNRAPLLRQTIQSVLAQTFEDFDLFVSDNASDDDTAAVVRGFRDPRIVYVRNERNIGPRNNWERCLRLARGDYVSIFADDDLMQPENLARKVAVLRANPRVGLVHSRYDIIDETDGLVRSNTTWGHGPDRTADAVEPGHQVLAQMLLTYNVINAPTVVFRRACRERLGGFTPRLGLAFDWEYWMRIAMYFDIAFLASPLIQWRHHAGSETNRFAHTAAHQLTERAFREELIARRLILRRHGVNLPDHRALRRRVRAAMADKILDRVEAATPPEGRDPATAGFVLRMVRVFPGLLGSSRIWRLLLRGALRRRDVERLRRLWRLGRRRPSGPDEAAP